MRKTTGLLLVMLTIFWVVAFLLIRTITKEFRRERIADTEAGCFCHMSLPIENRKYVSSPAKVHHVEPGQIWEYDDIDRDPNNQILFVVLRTDGVKVTFIRTGRHTPQTLSVLEFVSTRQLVQQ